MIEKTKLEFSGLQELVKCCDDLLDYMGEFRGQLTKIIEVKKKLSDNAGEDMGLGRAQDAASTKANLEEINLKLSDAISEVKQLSEQALLSQQPQMVLDQGIMQKGKEA